MTYFRRFLVKELRHPENQKANKCYLNRSTRHRWHAVLVKWGASEELSSPLLFGLQTRKPFHEPCLRLDYC